LIPAIKGRWSGDYAHDRQYWQFPATSRRAAHPCNSPTPPIWVAARDPNSHEVEVANGCHGQSTTLHKPVTELETPRQRI